MCSWRHLEELPELRPDHDPGLPPLLACSEVRTLTEREFARGGQTEDV